VGGGNLAATNYPLFYDANGNVRQVMNRTVTDGTAAWSGTGDSHRARGVGCRRRGMPI
jgi:hypothetical protein